MSEAPSAERDPDPDVFAAVLQQLDEGKHIVDIAKTLKLVPRELDPIYRWWIDHRGAYVVTADLAEELQFRLKDFVKKPAEYKALETKPAVVLEMIDRMIEKLQLLGADVAEKKSCKSCKEDAAKYCPPCARKKFAREVAIDE